MKWLAVGLLVFLLLFGGKCECSVHVDSRPSEEKQK